MTDAAKAFVWQATWQPWGGVQAITGTAVLNARFPKTTEAPYWRKLLIDLTGTE